MIGLAITAENYVGFSAMLVLWVFALLGQSLAEIPSETLIGENIPDTEQGKVYGSHFAFSHLWWAIAYPIAGFLGSHYPNQDFLYGGILTICLAITVIFLSRSSIGFQKMTAKNRIKQ